MIPVIDPITEVLRTVIVSNEFIHIDLWSIIHIIVAILIVLLLSVFTRSIFKKLWILFIVLVLWEVLEFVLYGIVDPPLITTESTIDVASDIILGMFAGIVTAIIILFTKTDKKK